MKLYVHISDVLASPEKEAIGCVCVCFLLVTYTSYWKVEKDILRNWFM